MNGNKDRFITDEQIKELLFRDVSKISDLNDILIIKIAKLIKFLPFMP